MEEDPTSPVVRAFLAHLEQNRREGEPRLLREYLKMFPGDEEGVARAWLEAVGEGAVPAGPSPNPGETSVGPYRIIKELGRGGQGVVYLAEDRLLSRRIALKVVRGLGSGHDEVRYRFQQGAEIASALEHPLICSVYEANLFAEVPYIAMQLVEGESLDQRIASARSDSDTSGLTCITLGSYADLETLDTREPEDAKEKEGSETRSSQSVRRERAAILQSVQLFETVARTLHYAHQRGVVHRDIKPANIMITPQGQPILMDFDMARDDRQREPALTSTGDFFGSPAYVPPEVLRGDVRSLDARGDVWALAVSLFEAISLERPFVASTREGLFQAILTREPRDLRQLQPACPPDLWVVIRRALEKEREHRFSTAEEFADELGRVLRDEPVLSHPHSPASAAWRWVRRHPWHCATFALAGTVAALLVRIGQLTSS